MKTKSLIICLLIGISLFSSCSKDGDTGGDSTNIASLLASGAWAYEKYDETNQELYSSCTALDQYPDGRTSFFYDNVYTFNPNGTFVQTHKTETNNGSYTLEGNKLTLMHSNSIGNISITCYVDHININGKSVLAIRSKEKTELINTPTQYHVSESKIFLQVQPEWNFRTYH